MEDSEKRKELLKAMRMEAAAQNNDDSTGPETSMNTAHLSNPLAETSTQQQESYDPQRFDYYTDPMSAYSSFKKNKTPKQQYTSSPSYQISSPVPRFPPSVPGACFLILSLVSAAIPSIANDSVIIFSLVYPCEAKESSPLIKKIA